MGFGRGRGGDPDLAVGLEHVEHRSGLDHVAFGRALLDHQTRTRRRKLHRRLVGHHLDHGLVFGYTISDADEPLRHLGFSEAFADIREPKLEARHQSRVVATIASSTRSAFGT